MAFKSYKTHNFKTINPNLMKSISNYSSYHHLCIHVMFILLLHDFVLLFIVLLFLACMWRVRLEEYVAPEQQFFDLQGQSFEGQ